jgi:hypothetical protein
MRILMLVWTGVAEDARVKRESATLAEAGRQTLPLPLRLARWLLLPEHVRSSLRSWTYNVYVALLGVRPEPRSAPAPFGLQEGAFARRPEPVLSVTPQSGA